MKSIGNIIFEAAVVANIFHIIISILYSTLNIKNSIISGIFLFLIVVVWIVAGLRFSFKGKIQKESSILIFGIITLLPVMILLIAGQIFQGSSLGASAGPYSMFFFIGAPILLWNGPMAPVMSFFKDSNIYVQFDINIVMIYFLVFLGGFIGMKIKEKSIKSSKRIR